MTLLLGLTVVGIFLAAACTCFAVLATRANRQRIAKRLAEIANPTPCSFVVPPTLVPATRAATIICQAAAFLGTHRRTACFNAQIPDTLLLLASALRAGHSQAGAMQLVEQESMPPISEEFAAANAELRLGLSVTESLSGISSRVASADWELAVIAMTVQLRAGGNLADALERIAGTIRERVRVQAETSALTAEGRYSAVILVLLPPIVAVLLALRNPRYFQPLTSTSLGHHLLIGAALGQILGTLVLQRILRLEE